MKASKSSPYGRGHPLLCVNCQLAVGKLRKVSSMVHHAVLLCTPWCTDQHTTLYRHAHHGVPTNTAWCTSISTVCSPANGEGQISNAICQISQID